MKKHYPEIIIFTIFIALTIILTYPLILKINSSIFSDPNWTFDSLGAIYGIWWMKYAFTNEFPHYFNHLIAFPFGIDYSLSPSQPGYDYPLLLLSLWKNEFFAYNIYILSSFILAAIIMYYLTYHISRSKVAAAFSGLIFSFCPNHSLQAFSHLGLAAIQWIPLYLLSLLKFNETRSYKNGFFVAATFSLVLLSNYYYGYFVFVATAGFVFFKLGYILKNRIQDLCLRNEQMKCKMQYRKNVKIILFTVLLVLIMILPFTYHIFKTAFFPVESNEVFPAEYRRSYNDLYRYAARLKDYFAPSEYHPIFGKVNFWFIKPYATPSRHWSERTLYLGVTPLVLAIYGIRCWWKKRKKTANAENFYIALFIFLGLLSFFFSLSPVVRFWKIKIPTLSYFMYRIVPMFRVYARFGFLVNLSIAVLAGFGLRDLLLRIKKKRSKMAVISFAFALVLFEFTVIPPFRNVDFSKTPAVYQWLAKQPPEVIVAEYPLVRSIEEQHYRYLFYQRVHKKKLINGARKGTIASSIRKQMRNIFGLETAALLHSLGTTYIIIHKDVYNKQDIQRIEKNSHFFLVKDFPSCLVYFLREINAK